MLLTILKYLGLLLAAVSSIWGLTQELTVKTADNRKRLTRAGIVSICFVLTGLVLSIVSDDIGRRHAAAEQTAKQAAEARRTNQIIIASQPLTSLSFTLDFQSADTALRRKMEEGDRDRAANDTTVQGGVPRIPYDAIEYESAVLPVLYYLSHAENFSPGHAKPDKVNEEDENGRGGVVALLPLDDSPNTILSFGDLYGDISWDDDDSSQLLSAGFAPVDYPARGGNSIPWVSAGYPKSGPSSYTLRWDLDPVTLENAVDRANTAIRSGAKMPPVLNFVLLRVAETIPFSKNNFAWTSATNLWLKGNGKENKAEAGKLPVMTLSVEVNGFSDFEYHYKLVQVSSRTLYNEAGEEIETNCTVLRFELDEQH